MFLLALIEDLVYAREPTRHVHTLSPSGLPLSVSESMKVNIYLFTQFLHNHSLRIEPGLVMGGQWSSLLLPIEWSWHKTWRELNSRVVWGCGSTQSELSGPRAY